MFSFKDIQTYLPIIFRGFHFMAQGFSNFLTCTLLCRSPPPPSPFNYLLILFPGSVYEAESLDKITQTASACRSPLGNDSQIARCSVCAGCWTDLNAIYSWRGCDKAGAGVRSLKQEDKQPRLPSGARRIFYGLDPRTANKFHL